MIRLCVSDPVLLLEASQDGQMVVVVFQARPGIVKIFDVERSDCATVVVAIGSTTLIC